MDRGGGEADASPFSAARGIFARSALQFRLRLAGRNVYRLRGGWGLDADSERGRVTTDDTDNGGARERVT